MKLALGTVQFGLAYGIANQAGQVSAEAGAQIVERARACGIDTIDTAIGYGTSESVLGTIGMERLNVVTKLPAIPVDVTEPGPWVRAHIAGSLERLGLTRLYGLLLHAPAQLSTPVGAALHDALLQVKADGLTEKIGVSVYSPSDLAAIWPRFAIDLVQAPLNVLDRRMIESGAVAVLGSAGVEFHVRSAFLQGLLVLPPEQRPAAFGRWDRTLSAYDAWVATSGLTRTEACLRVALGAPGVDRVVVGLDSVTQADELLAIAAAAVPLDAPDFGDVDHQLLDPSRWSQL